MLNLEFDFTTQYMQEHPFKLQLQCVPSSQRFLVYVTTYNKMDDKLVEDNCFLFMRCDHTTGGSRMYPDTFPPKVLCHVADVILSLPMHEFIDRHTISKLVRNVVDSFVKQ